VIVFELQPRQETPQRQQKPSNRKPSAQKPSNRKPSAQKPSNRKPANQKPQARKRPTKPEPKGKKTAARDEVELTWWDDIEFRPLAKGGYIH
jgi:hypothetical protein